MLHKYDVSMARVLLAFKRNIYIYKTSIKRKLKRADIVQAHFNLNILFQKNKLPKSGK